jgi:PAS domain S-box-containing protein
MTRTKVLVVDDEIIIARELGSRLTNLGYEVLEIASSGQEAVKVAEQTRPDLVLMDIVLKGEMDGVEAAAEIRRRWAIPIIYLTAYTDDATLQRARVTEPFGYIVKPFSERELRANIEMALYKHQVESKLRAIEKWFATSMQQIGDGVIATDTQGTITFMNQVTEALSGWKSDEAIGSRLNEIVLFVSSSRTSPLDPLALPVAESGIMVEVGGDVFLVSQRRNEKIPIYLAVTSLSGEAENATGIVIVMRDLSEQKRAVQLLRETEEKMRLLELTKEEEERQRLKTLIDTSPVGVLLVDACTQQVVLVNPEMQRIWGISYQPGKALDECDRGIIYRKPDGRLFDRAELPIRRALNRGETVRAEQVRTELPDGRTVPTLINVTPVLGSDGQITSAISIIQDLTPVEELEKLRNEFLGMVGHELKNPLSNIKGAAFVGLKSCAPLDSEEASELFDMIYEEAARMQDIIDNLLDINRIEAGIIPLTLEPRSLEQILEEAGEVFSRNSRSNWLVINIAEELPPVKVDRGRILQVMMNLLDNASKYSPPSAPISIDVETEPAAITVHVKDRGLGIPPDKLPLLFHKFARFHTGHQNAAPGTGLGLAICKGIIEAHGGRIWAASPGEGQGATFSFTLPAHAGPLAPATNDNKTQDIAAGSYGKVATILVVDDEQHATLIVQRLLAQAGYRTMTTGQPFQVAQLVESELPDLVLLDIRLPGASGFDLFREIREHSQAPIIFLSASDCEEDVKQALELGAADYITKPYSPADLLARLKAALRGSN